jgi:hypothetical protein
MSPLKKYHTPTLEITVLYLEIGTDVTICTDITHIKEIVVIDAQRRSDIASHYGAAIGANVIKHA